MAELITAILIDPFDRVVRSVADDFNDADVILQYLAQGGRGELRADLTSGPRIAADIHSYVDDFGCFREGQAWFRLERYPTPLAGYMLILGTGRDGSELPLESVLVHIIGACVEWEDPAVAEANFPPTTISSFAADGTVTVLESHPVDFTRREPFRKGPR